LRKSIIPKKLFAKIAKNQVLLTFELQKLQLFSDFSDFSVDFLQKSQISDFCPFCSFKKPHYLCTVKNKKTDDK